MHTCTLPNYLKGKDLKYDLQSLSNILPHPSPNTCKIDHKTVYNYFFYVHSHMFLFTSTENKKNKCLNMHFGYFHFISFFKITASFWPKPKTSFHRVPKIMIKVIESFLHRRLFVCLRFSSLSGIVHSYGDVTITGERLQI